MDGTDIVILMYLPCAVVWYFIATFQEFIPCNAAQAHVKKDGYHDSCVTLLLVMATWSQLFRADLPDCTSCSARFPHAIGPVSMNVICGKQKRLATQMDHAVRWRIQQIQRPCQR